MKLITNTFLSVITLFVLISFTTQQLTANKRIKKVSLGMTQEQVIK